MLQLVEFILLSFILSNISLNYQINALYQLYFTDNRLNTSYYDCLLYNTVNGINLNSLVDVKEVYSIIPYCIRPIVPGKPLEMMNGNISNILTFEQLKKEKIHVNELMSWSISIDIIEDYIEYLENSDRRSFSRSFFNCSLLWFGSHCQYTFDTDATFHDIVREIFYAKELPRIGDYPLNHTNLTCYVHLKCDRGPGVAVCLDWREICDGKIDCIGNGEDEMDCFELEINECTDDEYRCHNGLCISDSMFNDSISNPDCLDSTDEYLYSSWLNRKKVFSFCYMEPEFRCEETMYAFRHQLSICGDGEQQEFAYEIGQGLETTCTNWRNIAITTGLYSYEENSHVPYNCWMLLYCATRTAMVRKNYLYDKGERTIDCSILCQSKTGKCMLLFQSQCPPGTIIFPSQPILEGHIRFAYSMNRTVELGNRPLPDYICFDVKRMPFVIVTVLIDNFTCTNNLSALKIQQLSNILFFSQSSLRFNETDDQTHCYHPSLFHCPGTTKCISRHRLLDGRNDCHGEIDEIYNESCAFNERFRFQCTSEKKCLSARLFADGSRQCRGGEDEPYSISSVNKDTFFFQRICDGLKTMNSLLITQNNNETETETDETHCEEWPCDNVYTQCDNAWSCSNGIDERYCPNPWCSIEHHPCLSTKNHTFICLPYDQVSDGTIDCVGATDERQLCQMADSENFLTRLYRCQNSSECINQDFVCRRTPKACPTDNFIDESCKQDERVAAIYSRLTNKALSSDTYKYFQLQPTLNEEKINLQKNSTYSLLTNVTGNADLQIRQTFQPDYRRAWVCNRGILIFVSQQKIEQCLCPPSYYGNRCQYQSQRVSLTLKFRHVCSSDCRGAYGMIISLFDDSYRIHSQEQILYIPTRDCRNKSNIYLLYRSRPKNISKKYHVRIDTYKKQDLTYHVSWILPISFLFMPVNRTAVDLIIPSVVVKSPKNCTLHCGTHGQCSQTVNTKEMFCHCHSGWSGEDCSISYKCKCSPHALCVGPTTCLCPLNKRGPRCFLNSTCQINPCQNGALCIPNNQQLLEDRFSCICPDGFSGEWCEVADFRIDISFSNNIPIPQLLAAHLITARQKSYSIADQFHA